MWKDIAEFYDSVERKPLVLIFVFSVLLLIFSLAGGITYQGYFPLKEWPALILSVVAIALIAFSLFGIWHRREAIPSSGIDVTSCGIEYPLENSRVDKVTVTGSISTLPKNCKLRIFRWYPRIDQGMPIGGPAVIKGNKWTVADCDIGGKTDDLRDLVAMVVGESGEALVEYFQDAARVHYELVKTHRDATGKEAEYLPLIKRLTADIIECDRVSVIRK